MLSDETRTRTAEERHATDVAVDSSVRLQSGDDGHIARTLCADGETALVGLVAGALGTER